MNLHLDKKQFAAAISATSHSLHISPLFVEKDYWITLVLKRLSESVQSDSVVFKGGTSLSKGYKLINRFSEDVDIAVINDNLISGNVLKTKIRNIEKIMTVDLSELYLEGITSKGSKYRKTVFKYPVTINERLNLNISQRIIVETNAFTNPFPFHPLHISSFIAEFMINENLQQFISQYELEPFKINVLDKKRTLLEKFVSLIRFSFTDKPEISVAEKIRHFYDLYYLSKDEECSEYINSNEFAKELYEIIKHDQDSFNEPEGWCDKNIQEAPVIADFQLLWSKIEATYKRELSILSFKTIPDEALIAQSFENLIKRIKR